MQTADHILIPLLDASFAQAQIARIEDARLLLYVTNDHATMSAKATQLTDADILAVFCVDIANLPAGHWPVIGYETVPRIAPYNDLALADIDPTDPAVIEAFANAIHGLYPWDGFPDPDFFTNMLRSADTRGLNLRLKTDFPTAT